MAHAQQQTAEQHFPDQQTDQPDAGGVAALMDAAARRATVAAARLAAADDATIDAALRAMAELLTAAAPQILAANADDMAAAQASGMGRGLLDRLLLDDGRIAGMAEQLRALADATFPPAATLVRDLPGGLQVFERRRPVGVIGANYEARPNVTVDIAAQLVKSRNAGVLRTGGAALRSAQALLDTVVAPGLTQVGLDGGAIQLLRTPDREAARALVTRADLVPLVILRGSGDSTRELATEGARHGVRTLAHADGGGVLYVDLLADDATALDLITQSVDRLGVCNRLNLLLLHRTVYDELLPQVRARLDALGITLSLPPHAHARGHEWALDDGHEATVTVDVVADEQEAARIANEETSGLAAGIVTTDPETARRFMDSYRGTGAFWNATTRLLDGYKLLGVSETGINLDRVPGPRGPVSFRDLCLRQFQVVPARTSGSSHRAG